MVNETFYEIKKTTPEKLERKILQVLLGYIGSNNRISRADLVYKVFGVSVSPARLAGSTLDRKTRMAISKMQEKGMPIFSDSGQGGYYLGTKDECAGYRKEMENRKTSLAKKITALKRLERRLDTTLPLQPSLLDFYEEIA